MHARELATRHRTALICALSTALALVVRWSFAVDEHPPELYVVHDMQRYVAQGEALSSRSREAWDTFTPVGYPAFLALIGEVKRVGAWQAVLGALTAGLTALLAHRLETSDLAAAIAGIACALYAPLIFYTGFVLTETLCAFLITAAMVLLVTGAQLRRRALAVGGGIALGMATLVRPSLLPFVAALAWPALVLLRRGRRELVWALGATATVLIPIAIHTTMLLGRPALIASNGGVNFYLAHADCKSVKSTAGGAVVEVSTHFSRTHLERTCTTSEPLLAEPHFYAAGLRELTSHPTRILRAFVALGEGVGLAPARPYPDQPFWPGSMDHETTLNTFSQLFVALLLLPALAHAAVRKRRKTPRDVARWLLWLLIAGILFVLFAFNGNPRVRVSSDPIVIALAASALAAAIAARRQPSGGQ